jgi:signal transduction histidine kinase
MSWVTIIWSMIVSACLTLAAMYLLVWCREMRSWAYLSFFVLAVGVIGVAAGEFAAMYANSPTEYGRAVRWGHFAYLFVLVGSLGFVHFYFGTGRRWLLGSALGLRLLAVVVANFTTGLNLHISAIRSLQKVNFLGEQVSVLGEWTPNPWVRLGQLAALAQFVYVLDASLRLWRTGARESRRRAVIVGGTLAFFIVFASGQAGLVVAGVLRTPIVVSFPFLAVLLAMGYELSRDVQQLPLDLKDVLQEVLKLIHSDLVNQNVTARTELADDLPLIKGDRARLQQVLLNLVMNACDAMSGNAPADRQLAVRPERTDDDRVRVSVADGGVGLTPDKLEQVFMPFYTTKPHGLGVGLSVCRTIIAAHHGKISVENNAAGGATFRVTLPVVREG